MPIDFAVGSSAYGKAWMSIATCGSHQRSSAVGRGAAVPPGLLVIFLLPLKRLGVLNIHSVSP